ncbi:hypothetical protein EDEG_02359 [Edhazardia aedis USNM 41457]|uniref:Uncharacterized protein n=1 Tax=Edhazardia aedis (strain USNM 41457) TaxID=1003232 RepID=J8ZUE2_EDHAE|nr:hypothetical protein EDEG_02359 [Edhazardia aedis USNM 41457]|eukprot:EJW03293.1 hypothetical protein EDEG_02359 [Edhazardia aedis USNM 41457]
MKGFLLYAILFIFANASLPANNTQKNTYDNHSKESIARANTQESIASTKTTEADFNVGCVSEPEDISQESSFIRGSFVYTALRRKKRKRSTPTPDSKSKTEDIVKK